ncbi:LytTR family DNA-binding domain-containing protein [Aliiglaciecola sp. CAU 1673]|uniref:LytR/AlgR family response regulator transcription factor n=1 Tax=Aliiglaciecola sp. CAU 1673 TaxID=3032595 RepID=UPI0023DCCA1F|nr:LytTR family DNA-binding domain-containing protein [Aliiglaciecola sp. CAU 1673]MDF2177457.1 LytTR family DNA-binding domain-containing protein [Aliiglaciecola sp. CAU 1673]
MEYRDKQQQQKATLFERFDRRRHLYLWLAVGLYLLINNGINASSVWMEHNRDGNPGIALWEPIVWEYTSALSTLILLPLLFSMARRFPPKMTRIGQQILLHFGASLVLSLLHVALMVWMRELIYLMLDNHYQFGPLVREFFYEYRKDAWGYLFFYSLYQIYLFIYSRLRGEAELIGSQQANENQPVPDHLLVRKLDKEFLVKVEDIDYLESAGNYVNLYSGGRIYPLRATLATTLERLQGKGFSRIHRSYGVNHNAIDNIRYLPSGDGEIQLKNGQALSLSRRYKDDFKRQFH